MGSAATRTVLRLRGLSISRHRAALPGKARRCGRRRLLAPVLCPHARSNREHQAGGAGAQALSAGPGLTPYRAAQAPTGRRGLCRKRMPPRPDGLLRRRPARQGRGPPARAGEVLQLLQPECDQRNLPRLPHRRRAGDRGEHRYRHGGDRPVSRIAAEFMSALTNAFQANKRLADRAVEQVPDDKLHAALDANTNSIAVIMKHVAGNLLSRWTDFLTSDGATPWRNPPPRLS